jgi:two-component system alkaline phosphatase synthesis response regulator PhoP
MIHVLIVEDDPHISKFLARDLELEGYAVTIAKDGLDGLDQAKALKPDLILLDIRLPKLDGYEVCRSLRRDGSDVRIIMVTAKSQEAEKILGLEQGADDYITKPFSTMELIARIRALLRRRKREQHQAERFRFDDITVDFARMEATKKGKPLALTTKEFQMLELLVRNRGKVVSRNQFLEEIWGFELKPTTRTVDNRLVQLRRKLSPENPEAYILSIHGVGYKFIE